LLLAGNLTKLNVAVKGARGNRYSVFKKKLITEFFCVRYIA
jgi:hypothetical protein